MIVPARSVLGDWPPAVIVHGGEDVRLALLAGHPVTLLSAPGAGAYAGCGWWRALMTQASAAFPGATFHDILDCAEASGHALAALRLGQRHLVLTASAPGWDAVAAIAAAAHGAVFATPPAALDLAEHGAARRLHDWLRNRTARRDSTPPLR